MPPSASPRFTVCAICGLSFECSRNGPVATYCSLRCKQVPQRAAESSKRLAERESRPRICASPYCDRQFTPGHRTTYCSKVCTSVGSMHKRGQLRAAQSMAIKRGHLAACVIYIRECQDCGVTMVKRSKRTGKFIVCDECTRRRYQATDARRAHKRRALGPTVLSVHQIAERDGTRCYVCRRKVDMRLSGRAKWGPTIEHIVAVSLGGTNAPENLALSHRHCNVARGNRGHAQLTLAA